MRQPDEPGQHRSPRRWVMFCSLLRALLIAVLLVALYYRMPLDRSLDATTGIQLLIGLLLVAGVFAWQIMATSKSDYPRLRAVQAVATGVPLFLLLFALTYSVLDINRTGSFNEPLSRNDALYFTITVFATVGFGDIVPRTGAARTVTMIQMILDIVVIGAIAKVLLGAVQIGLRRRAGPQASRGARTAQDEPGRPGKPQ